MALYPWPQSVSWCLAEGYRNGDPLRPMGHVARGGLYFFTLSLDSTLCRKYSVVF